MSEPIRYRADWEGKRRRVVLNEGHEGFVIRWTDSCSGCYEGGEYGGSAHLYPTDPKAGCSIGFGCEECGYQGKVRHSMWFPFDTKAWREHEDRDWLKKNERDPMAHAESETA